MIHAVYFRPVLLADTIHLFCIKLFSSIYVLPASYGLEMMEKRVHKILTSLPECTAADLLHKEQHLFCKK